MKWHWPILTTENRKKLILRQKLGDLHYFTWNILEYSIFYSWIKIVTLYIETTEAWIVLNNLNLFCKELEFYYKIAFFKYSFIIQFCMALYWEDNFKRLLTKKKKSWGPSRKIFFIIAFIVSEVLYLNESFIRECWEGLFQFCLLKRFYL